MKRKPLRMLMITPFFRPNIGGVETHLDDLCTYLAGKAHKIIIITYQPLTTRAKGLRVERKHNLEIRRVGWFGYNWFNLLEHYPLIELTYLFPPFFFYALLFMLINAKGINVVHTHGTVASLVGKLLKLIFKARYIATVHTTYHLEKKPILGRIFTWILSSYDQVLFVSEGIKREFMRFGLDERKVRVFTYWANKERFKPMDKFTCKNMLDWDRNFTVLFVGRLVKEKGAFVLVEAAKKIKENVRFAFITSGSEEEFIKMVGSNMPDNVVYVGPVDYSRLHLYYNAADLFILPSQHREGFSRAVLESALCGTPVIASKVGCLAEVVSKEVGFLIDPPTPEKFAEAIEYFYRNKEELKKLSVHCAHYAHERFTEENAKVIEDAIAL